MLPLWRTEGKKERQVTKGQLEKKPICRDFVGRKKEDRPMVRKVEWGREGGRNQNVNLKQRGKVERKSKTGDVRSNHSMGKREKAIGKGGKRNVSKKDTIEEKPTILKTG